MGSIGAGGALEVVKAHMAAEDRQDLDATVATFTEQCWYRVPGLGLELRGKEEIRGWYEDLFRAVPVFRNSEERFWECGSEVFFEAFMEGTHLGEWFGWAPTGRTFRSAMLVRIPMAADGSGTSRRTPVSRACWRWGSAHGGRRLPSSSRTPSTRLARPAGRGRLDRRS